MGAIVKEVGADEAPVLAFLAGSDLLLMPTDVGRAIDAMVRAVDSGRISRARVDQSVRKILEMKERLGLFEQREVDLDRVSSVVGRAEFRDDRCGRVAALDHAAQGFAGPGRPAARRRRRRVTLVVMAENGTTLGATLASELRRKGFTVRQVTLPLLADSADARFGAATDRPVRRSP